MERPIVQPLPQEEALRSLADLYRVFGDGTRLKILCALLKEEKCVCDLAAEIGASVSAVSPLRWETTAVYPARCASWMASSVSLRVPI